jgi:P4 family phage/plasmid primase-like protien
MVTDNEQPVNPAPGPAEYERAGFRILPIASDGSKRPLCGAGFFGKDQPEATVPAAQWPPGAGVAILCGPTPRWSAADTWLAVIDIDGDSTLEQLDAFVGEKLPPTLTSKGQRHLYFAVLQSEARDALRQWAPLFGRKTDGAPKVDLKWSGGYAIEPTGAWDGGWAPERITVLPESWIRKVLAIRNARPATPATAPAKTGARVELGELPADAVRALALVWPGPGGGCHEAALALGGVLGGSDWTDDAICAFARALYEQTGTKDRTSDVVYSANTKRNGGEAKGWPTLKALLEQSHPVEQVRGALATLRASVPGLAAPRPFVPPTPELDDQGRAVPQGAKADLKLNIGSDDEIATKVVASRCPGAVYDEGALWEYNSARDVWETIPEHILSGWIEVYDGAVYDYTDKGRPIWVKLGAGRVSSIRQRIEAKRTAPGFFAAAPVGLAFQNGFLALGRGGSREFGPLGEHHRARWTLPCDFGLDAARRAPPVNWVRYLRSIWGDDREAIDLVHQILGYLLSGRHDYQKIFVLLGPPRAGKGTLLNLIQSIFRDQATSFKVASLDQTFSLQSMLGKSVAYDPDVRRASSMFKSEGQMVERLLSLSSADTQVVPRKNTTDVVTKLPCRLLLAANPPFGLTDVGGALASRFVILTFPRSFLGSEDRDLGARLEREIPAIVALALDGLDRLDRVGRFVEPASSAEERASIERAQNPMVAFLEECTETGSGYATECGAMYAAVTKWREANGHKRLSNQAFGEFMRQRGFHQERAQVDGSRVRFYDRIRLRPTGTPNLTLIQGGK